MPSNAANINNEKKNGGRWNNKIPKSVTNKLVKRGCSMRIEITFLNIINSNQITHARRVYKNVKNQLEFYSIHMDKVKENKC